MLLNSTPSSAQDLEWAKRAGGTSFDYNFSGGIAADTSGNSYVTGSFNGSATFGAGETNETTLVSAGESDIFVAKYDSSGMLVWAKRAGGTTFESGVGIAVDSSGNSYIMGSFFGSSTFGAGETNETSLVSAGGSDIFVAKYDSSGMLVWAKQAGGTSQNEGLGIAVDTSGNSYVTGFFNGSSTFGTVETNETTLVSAGDFDIFVAKYDSSGMLVWAKRAGGTSHDNGRGIAVDSSGNSYVMGIFIGSATFGAAETNETTLVSAGGADIFVAKYDGSGMLVWGKRAGGGGFELGDRIAVDGSGNSYVTGLFEGLATFGLGEANETTLVSCCGLRDIFVAQYDSSGTLVWAKRAGSVDHDQGIGIAVDGSGNSYVTGRFAQTATFGAGEVNQTMLVSAGGNDIFVAKYDSSGMLVWAKRAGGANCCDDGIGIAVDGSGNSYVTGNFGQTAIFGAGEVNQTTLVSAGFNNFFVAKYAGGVSDITPPAITITSPAANATYQLNASVAASYACNDSGSGVASCQGPVANGSPIDTSSTGTKTFMVTSSDNVGNTGAVTVTYSVVSGGGGGSTSADLSITLSAPSKVSPGGTLTYSITVANAGKVTATGIVVSDALPVGTVFASAAASQGLVVTPPVGSNGTVTVDLGSLANGANATVSIVATVTAAAGTVLIDTATVTANTQDLNSRNNSATQKTTVSKK